MKLSLSLTNDLNRDLILPFIMALYGFHFLFLCVLLQTIVKTMNEMPPEE